VMRAALYARYSTDLQNVASISDQFAVCRALVGRDSIAVTATFEDAAISGGSTANRPGLRALMRGAADGEFDLVVCEALDRLSRSQADVAAIFLKICAFMASRYAPWRRATSMNSISG
jgi:site-specific DNA recombinase